MDKKILNLTICVLICFILILGLFIFKFTVIKSENTPKQKVETILEETVIDDPVKDGFKIHTSKNGYTIKYPSDMQAKEMARSVDFILEDEKSGSSLNVITAKNDGTLKKMTREEFEYSLLHTSEDAVLLDYDDITINGTEAVKASFTYMGSITEQHIIITDGMSYNISVTKADNITDEMSAIFDNTVKSFTLN